MTEQPDKLAAWCRSINWAVTTEADCYGWQQPRPEWERERYALYDSSEDDPPIGIFEDRDTALAVAAALTLVGQRDATTAVENVGTTGSTGNEGLQW